MIPDCLKNSLREDQIEKVQKWSKDLIKKHNPEADDCSCASNITFNIYGTGLGDVIWAEGFGEKCSLTIDDDGDLID